MLKNIIFAILFINFAACNSSKTEVIEMESSTEEYKEKHRPQVHFSPPTSWMNDPNGMVYYEGEYHLFYQYYPDSTVWGPMHWGHAVSEDLVSWENLPIALYPDSLGYIFSGSAVVDWKNSSGLGEGDKPPLVAMFTHHLMSGEKAKTNNFQYQSLAYSNDKGRTWTKYPGNPVIPNTENIKDFRDPKVVWSDDFEKWVLVFATYDYTMFWTSDNLIDWTHVSDFGAGIGEHGGVWECPDFFKMKVEGSEEEKWVLIQSLNPGAPNGGSGSQYFIGDFDGENFTMDQSFAAKVKSEGAVWLDYGRDNYAGVTWSDVPSKDGRRIFIGWMSNWQYAQVVPTEKWRSALTIPRTLHLVKSEEDDYSLSSRPADELKALHNQSSKLKAENSDQKLALYTSPNGSLVGEVEFEVNLKNSEADGFVLQLSNGKGESYQLHYHVSQNALIGDRSASGPAFGEESFYNVMALIPRHSENETIKFQVFIDVSSIEVFLDNGSTVVTEVFFPNEDFNTLELVPSNGKLDFKGGVYYSLNSIW